MWHKAKHLVRAQLSGPFRARGRKQAADCAKMCSVEHDSLLEEERLGLQAPRFNSTEVRSSGAAPHFHTASDGKSGGKETCGGRGSQSLRADTRRKSLP